MRNSIRHTWVNNTYFTSQSGVVKVLFLLGKSNESTIQRQLELEFERFQDLLQGDFIDSYYNLSLKGTMAYKWVTERCGNAKVIIKVDDDVVVNMVEILANINKFMKPRSVVCNLAVQAPIFRNETDKCFVPNSLFPSTKYYPNYCKGGFVSFSNDLIPELFKSATITPFFWIDDVYLYGLVLNNLLEITITSLVDTTDQYHSSVCRKRPVCPYLVVLLMEREPSEMQRVWSSMLRHSQV
jgi:beta-1,3-galactosyltransferase 1